MPLSNWFRRAPSRRRKSSKGASPVKECASCRIELPDAARFCYLCGRTIEDDGSPFGGGDEAVVAALRERLASALGKSYVVGDVLGKGGMGIVFLAEDRKRDAKVAVKVMRPEVSADEIGVSRFRREAEIAASLEHPGIIPILKVGSAEGLHYFVMQYVAGYSLDALLDERRAEGRALPVGAATRVLCDAAAALAYAHARNVVHRDVKPANIMLDDEGRVLLTDFGISKNATAASGATTVARLTDTGTVLGTPQYLAPEQALGTIVDGRADQYALAVVGFEMIAGHVPFDDETPHAIIHRHVNDAPPPLASLRDDVPAHVAAAIARALSKAPSHRFASMDDFRRALAGEPTDAARTIRRRAVVRRVVAALVVAAVGGGALFVTTRPDNAPARAKIAHPSPKKR
jgi:serine/threonine-protein kinase